MGIYNSGGNYFVKGHWFRDCIKLPGRITLDGEEIVLKENKQLAFDNIPLKTGVLIEGNEKHSMDEGIRGGSIRLTGYRTGWDVTLFGKCDSDGTMIVERVFGGNRNEYLTFIREKALSKLINLCLFLIIVSIILIGRLVIKSRKKRKV